jgi:hypothetical protein
VGGGVDVGLAVGDGIAVRVGVVVGVAVGLHDAVQAVSRTEASDRPTQNVILEYAI